MDHRSEADIHSFIESTSISNDGASFHAEGACFQDRNLLELLEKGCVETMEEMNAYTREISSFLAELDLDIKSLPADIRDGLDRVAYILKTEGLTDMNETELEVILNRKRVEEKKRLREEANLALKYALLSRKQATFQRKLHQLQESVDSLQSFRNSEKEDDSESNRIVLTKKLSEYQQTVEKLENDLEEMQLNELYPDNILSKYQQYLNLTEELGKLDMFLDQYEGLPPDLLQAKAILESKKKECEELERLFKDKTN